MPTTTVQVAISVVQIVGTALAGGRVQFTATRPDINGAIVVPAPTSVPLDANGLATANLVPNASGTQGAQYSVQIYDASGDLQFTGLATIPATNCNLHDVLSLPAPPFLTAIDAGSPSVQLSRVQTRRGTALQWSAANPVLADGEEGYETDTKKLKIGDGVTAWNALTYRLFDPASVAITGGAIAGTDVRKTVIPYRASRSPNVYGNAGIIDRMQADIDLWNVWCFGDSRTNGIVTGKYVALAPSTIPLGGALLANNSLTPPSQNATNVFLSSLVTSSAGDAIPTSPYIGYAPDNVTVMEFKSVVGGITFNGNTLQNRLTNTAYSGWDFSTATTLNARLNARQVRARTLVRRSPAAWSTSITSPLNGAPTMPNLYLQVRQNGSTGSGDAGYYKSNALPIYTPDAVDYVAAGVTIPAGLNWTTNKLPDISHVCEPNITMGVDAKIVSASYPWLELPTGILMRETGCVSGRSIAALLNEEVTPVTNFTRAMRSCGGQHALWVEIGTNNPKSQTVAQFQSDLMSFIEKFRAGAPDAPVILMTAYAANADAGVTPYYVTAARNIAAIDRNVVCIDTYAAMPGYAAGVALGYYGGSPDGTHYVSAGQTALVGMYWSLWNAA